MLHVPIKREQLIQFLPEGGRVAEIGVCKGEFSRSILDTVKPDRLHLIDPWCFQDDEDYRADPSNASDDEHADNHAAVTEMFKDEIADRRVVVHRAFSADAVGEFADGSLDWVYVDGLHTYEGCKADLEAYAAKVKANGFILGHDYTNHYRAQQMNFGVVEAVNEFVRETDCAFLALTAEIFPTFMLAKNMDGEAAQLMFANLVFHVPGVVEIENMQNRTFTHKVIPFGDKGIRMLHSY